MASNGEHVELLNIPAGGSRLPSSDATYAARQHYIKIAGRQIAKFATKIFIELVEKAMAACELTTDEVDLLIPHQVNERIIDAALRRLGLPRERCVINIDRYGNTSAASVPIALNEALRQGRLRPGQTAIMIGFGAGLTWGATVLKI
jgi:3-oxoacyl-[acyl-carrier-protein] synthase-3